MYYNITFIATLSFVNEYLRDWSIKREVTFTQKVMFAKT